MPAANILIERRFRGPPDSGNGGYSCGRLAAFIDGPAEVTLKAPPPLEVPLRVTEGEEGVRLLHGEREIATARALSAPLAAPPRAPERAAIRAAAPNYEGFKVHILPPCFVCGTERGAGDGLRIFPAPIAGSDLVAAEWQPGDDLARQGVLAPEFIWAALDCPGYFALRQPGLFTLLGRLSGRIMRLPKTNEPLIATGWPMGSDGRKHFAGTALYGADGEPIAQAVATWVELKTDPRDINPNFKGATT